MIVLIVFQFLVLAPVGFANAEKLMPEPPVLTEKYSELFTNKFYTWFNESVFKINEKLNKNELKIVNNLLVNNKMIYSKISETYFNNFALGYVQDKEQSTVILQVTQVPDEKQLQELFKFKKWPELQPDEEKLSQGVRFTFLKETKQLFLVQTIKKNQKLIQRYYILNKKVWQLESEIKLKTENYQSDENLSKSVYQIDELSRGQKKIFIINSLSFVNEKYFSMPAQEIINNIRRSFNLDPRSFYFNSVDEFGFYYP